MPIQGSQLRVTIPWGAGKIEATHADGCDFTVSQLIFFYYNFHLMEVVLEGLSDGRLVL